MERSNQVISIVRSDNRAAAVIVCDICTKEIRDVEMAAAVYQINVSNGASVTPLHAHKGRCHDAAEAQLGGKSETGWAEMREHLFQLCANSGFDDRMYRSTEMLNRALGSL